MLDGMTVTFSILDVLLAALIITAIIVLIQLGRLISRVSKSLSGLGETMGDLGRTMENAASITDTVREGTQKINGVLDKAGNAAEGVCDIVNTNKSKIGAVTGIVNAATSLSSIASSKKKK